MPSEAAQLATTVFSALATSNPTRAREWISELPVYQRPRSLNLEALKSAIPEGSRSPPVEVEPAAEPEALIAHRDRLQAFDLGNGDYLSCVSGPGLSLWIDDWREGPTGIVARSVAELLKAGLSPDCLDPDSGDRMPPWQE